MRTVRRSGKVRGMCSHAGSCGVEILKSSKHEFPPLSNGHNGLKDERYTVPSFLNYRNSFSEIRVGISPSVPLHGEVEGGVKSDFNTLIKASTEDKELWGKATGFSYGLGVSELSVHYHPASNRSNPQGCSEWLCELTTVRECLGKG